jgi:ABC-type bacteriocin/lantibiotic exporter with double-glycine peptidase domain
VGFFKGFSSSILRAAVLPSIGVLLASGCASSGKLADIGTFSSKAKLLEVPFQRQADPTLCGVAVAQMLSQYYSRPLREKDLAALKREARKMKGIKGSSLEKAFQAAGYHTAIFAGSLDRKPKGLYHHVDLKRPLIVMLSQEGSQENHYQLVAGYDPKRALVSVLDPAKGPLALPVASFKSSWERAKAFTFLAVPTEKD